MSSTPSKFSGSNNPMFGRQHSAETRAKISAAHRGKLIGAANPMFGRKHSPESIERIKIARKGKALGNQNAAREKKYSTTYYARHKEAIRLRKRERLDTDPAYRARQTAMKRASVLRMRYGITAEAYDAMLLAQGGGCAVCCSMEPGSGQSLFFDVDHCHSTGKVRGLLCRKCNVTAGVLEKNRELIAKIEAYLAAHKDDPK